MMVSATTTDAVLSGAVSTALEAAAYGVTATWHRTMSLIPGYDAVLTATEGMYFSPKVADSVVSFFETQLTHTEGELAGKPLLLEPWQKAVIGSAFGWFRADGLRRYRKVFMFVPRKNGKTALTAGLVLLMALCDGEPGAQIYSAAAEREQAAIIYRNCAGMLANNQRLAKRARPYVTTKSIEFKESHTYYRALSADAKTKHGFNSHFIIGDELHAMRDDELLRTLETSTGSRRQPLIWYITTSDYDRESVCNAEYDYAVKVRDRILPDSSHLPVIYEAKPDDDYLSEAVWRKANPNYGISVKPDYLRAEAKRAEALPSYRNTFKRLHLNIRTQTSEQAIDLAHWDRCNRGVIDESLLAGRKAWLALDFSRGRDTTAAVLCVPPDKDGQPYIIIPRIYIPKGSAVERQEQDKVPYIEWQRAGFIRFTEGNYRKEVDYQWVKDDLADWFTAYNIRAVLADPWQGKSTLQELDKLYRVEVADFPQSAQAMENPIIEFERLYMSGNLSHGGHPVLRWMASNVSTERTRRGQVRWVKMQSTLRIDGIIASVMAVAGALQKSNDGEASSVYDREERGVIVL